MKKDNWLVYLIVLLTSSTTVLTMWDGSLFSFLRGLGFAFVLDGLVIYMEHRSETLLDQKQRDIANVMKWAGVGMLVTIAASYAFVSLVPVDAKQTVNVFGMTFSSTIRELVHWVIVGMISLWVVLTLGVVLYVRQIDPTTAMKLEYTKAAQERAQEKLNAYKVANKYTASELGKQEALEEYREDLKKTGRYTEGEIASMVMLAGQEIDRQKLIPVGVSQTVAANTYASTANTVELKNPTPASKPNQK